MGRIYDAMMEYPDAVLTATGFVGGFGLGTANGSPLIGIAVGVLLGLLVYALERHEPWEGPHQ